MSGAIASVYAVFADLGEARRIGRTIVEERLAACVNIIGPCESLYHWQGAIEQASEVAAVFKTRRDAAPALLSRISELHSYEVPAVTVWDVADTLPAYAQWVRESVRP
ncbi:MAG: divalent-cation tolerance protein CutA [Alphaproteobacteria bacterium]|nr:divalent-cation tolerance protein CutA [Alphaproteobacteria bacterium]